VSGGWIITGHGNCPTDTAVFHWKWLGCAADHSPPVRVELERLQLYGRSRIHLCGLMFETSTETNFITNGRQTLENCCNLPHHSSESAALRFMVPVIVFPAFLGCDVQEVSNKTIRNKAEWVSHSLISPTYPLLSNLEYRPIKGWHVTPLLRPPLRLMSNQFFVLLVAPVSFDASCWFFVHLITIYKSV
jgi:hypothetical protein